MKKSLFALLLFIASPIITHAHTRWFDNGEVVPISQQEPTTLYLSIIAGICAIIIAIGIWLTKRGLLQCNFLILKQKHSFEHAASTFTMVAGAFFMIAGTHEYLFSPNLSVQSGIPSFLIYIQILIGLAFLLGIGARVAALALISLWAYALFSFTPLLILENIWILSTALFILTMGNDYFSMVSFSFLKKHFKPFKEYGLSFLRIGTGATLLTLGFSEKILKPELGMNFLSQYDWNFMQPIVSQWGLTYSDYLFTLSAGATEALLGLLLLLGISTRLTSITISILFTIPLFILGPLELSGHMPHFAAILLIVFFGGGKYFNLIK